MIYTNKEINLLSQSLLFKDLEKDKIDNFLQNTQKVILDKGKLFSEQELKLYLFIPISSRVKSYQVNPNTGKVYTIFLFHIGDIFDIINFIEHQEHNVIFEVTLKGEFIKIPHSLLEEWIVKEPQINKNILFLLSNMLVNIEENATNLALYDSFTRLSKLIIHHLCSNSFDSKTKLKHINNFSHEEMAHLIGTTREVVSRHIKTLKKNNILKTHKQRHHIVNLEALLEYCHIPHKKKSSL